MSALRARVKGGPAGELSINIRLFLRGGRDLKVRPPSGQAWTAPDTDGQDAEHRGLATVADGPDGPGADPECQRVSESVSALLAGAIAALDAGDLAEARDLLGRLQVFLGADGGA